MIERKRSTDYLRMEIHMNVMTVSTEIASGQGDFAGAGMAVPKTQVQFGLKRVPQ